MRTHPLRNHPIAGVLLVAALALGLVLPAGAEPQSDWVDEVHGYCAIDTHRIPPGHEDYRPGDPAFDAVYDVWGDPKPGTAEWDAQMDEKQRCNVQRTDYDRQHHPAWLEQSLRYGQDFYRDPERHDGIRFRHVDLPWFTVPLVTSAEVFLPCPTDESVCPDLPAELERFDPPYPVVIVLHGLTASKEQHRYNTQAFAEAGYMAIGVNGLPGVGPFGPNFQRCGNIDSVLDWLADGRPLLGHDELSAELGGMADLDRVGLAGHSQGSLCAMRYQDDPRIHTIISWDNTDDADAATPHPKPIMYQRTDGGSGSTTSQPFDELPDPEGRSAGYTKLRERGVDVMHLTFRATTHVTWNGNGVALDGNRLGELVINHYNLAWLDRHLRGRLVFDADGEVVTAEGRTEAEEREFRQAIAQDAFDRLTLDVYDDSADRHNISAGWWSPSKAEASGDLRYGGNVPYVLEGFPADGLLSRYHRSRCFVSVPDYVNGATGAPGETDDPVVARADTTAGYSMRHIGCPADGLPEELAPGVPLPAPGLEGR
jgi:dienelactone hydrolase